jgi:hypothetical protein
MRGRFLFGWLIGLAMLGLFVGAGVYVYDLGVARGIMQGAQTVAAAPGAAAAPVVPYAPYWAYYPRPWGFGFFPFFPLLFVVFAFIALRGLFWRRRWYGYGRGCGYGRGRYGYDEWHRRPHDQPTAPVNL